MRQSQINEDTTGTVTIMDTDANSRSFVGPLMKLARVEVQSIMQFLPRVELLHLSRCSRTLLADGDTDVAWMLQPIYDFPLFSPDLMTTLTRESLTSLVPSNSLILRHQPTFHVAIELDGEVGVDIVKLIVETILRIVKLTFQGYTEFTCEEWRAILSPYENLQQLNLECICDNGARLSDFLAILQPMAHLHSFSFSRIEHSDSAHGLVHLPSLTKLMFEDHQVNDGHSIASSLINCERVTYLDITSLLLKVKEFNRVFSSNNLAHSLRELHLSNWSLWRLPKDVAIPDHLYPVTIDLLSQTWSHLTHLTCLSFNQIKGINYLLPTLKSAGSNLTHLSINSILFSSYSFLLTDRPTPPILIDLLNHHPQLLMEVIRQDRVSAKWYDPIIVSHPQQFKMNIRLANG